MGRNITLYLSPIDDAKIALLREYMKIHYTMNVERLDDAGVIMAAFDVQCLNTIGEVNMEIIPCGPEMEA